MPVTRLLRYGLISCLLLFAGSGAVFAQSTTTDDGYGPVVRAYLGYLRNEKEVVDDRVSRHEVSPVYYRRNSNRIRALRQAAVRIASETQNDYLPELEAVAGDELRLLFERPPRLQALRVGEVVNTTFRYLGTERSGDVFYIFARLDPYEQAELMQKVRQPSDHASGTSVGNSTGLKATSRSRRVTTP